MWDHSPHTNSWFEYHRWHFDIDRYINPFIPAPPWRWLPRPISHFLGYRPQPPPPMGNVLIALWSLVSIFCGLSIITSVTMNVPAFQHHNSPSVIASFGAAAVLEYCAIESPFSQPRNAIIGQTLASVIGVCIAKLFALNPHAKHLPELGGPLSVAIVTALMALTNTIHPPAGATALLAVTQVPDMGWWLIPVVLLGVALMQVSALLFNNIQRRFPIYWWTAHDLSKRPEEDEESARDKERRPPSTTEESFSDQPEQVIVRKGEVFVPDSLWVSAEEREALERISERIK
ncbi:HPP family [Aspergillus sclerotialis]|uniref:HPP family n=1 Tax=Aspergillus sclerotialis TaxID=2070753 RepID=A0A3A2ZQE3_9EURO|nr:HPP family [Aspergillus sclerotialis]